MKLILCFFDFCLTFVKLSSDVVTHISSLKRNLSKIFRLYAIFKVQVTKLC